MITRRAAGTIGLAAFASAASQARATPDQLPGLERSAAAVGGPPAVYYEILMLRGARPRGTVVMIHGGAHTGSCFLFTPDGRPGWAPVMAALGYRVIVPDWPGSGRSGGAPIDQLDGALVASALAEMIASLGEPVTVMTHSMSGAFGWKLLETLGARVRKLVAVAPGPPGNIQPPAAVVSRGAGYVEIGQPAATIRVDLDKLFFAPPPYIERKLIGAGDQFPRAQQDQYRALLQGIAPKLLLERTNVDGGQLRVADPGRLAGAQVLIVIGTHDIDHSEASDQPIVDWLNTHGAHASLLPLGRQGIVGNGHMMMIERNSDAIIRLIADWIAA